MRSKNFKFSVEMEDQNIQPVSYKKIVSNLNFYYFCGICSEFTNYLGETIKYEIDGRNSINLGFILKRWEVSHEISTFYMEGEQSFNRDGISFIRS